MALVSPKSCAPNGAGPDTTIPMGPAQAPLRAVTRRGQGDPGGQRVPPRETMPLPHCQSTRAPAGGPSRPRGSLSLTPVCQIWGQGYAGGGGGQTQLGVPGHSWAGSRLPIQQLQPSGPSALAAPPRGGQQPARGRNAGMQECGGAGAAGAGMPGPGPQAESLPSCAEARGPAEGAWQLGPDSHLGKEPGAQVGGGRGDGSPWGLGPVSWEGLGLDLEEGSPHGHKGLPSRKAARGQGQGWQPQPPSPHLRRSL